MKEEFIMAGDLKNRIRVSTTFQPELYQKLKEYSDKTSIPISKIIEKAITQFLDANTETK